MTEVEINEGRRLPNVMPAWWVLEEGGQRSARRIIGIWSGTCIDDTGVSYEVHDSRRWLGPIPVPSLPDPLTESAK